MGSAEDLEGNTAAAPEANHAEVGVEASRSPNPQPPHYGEAGSIDEREVLVAEGLADRPRRFQVRRTHRLDHCDAPTESVPKPLSRMTMDTMAEQEPSLDEYVIRSDEIFAGTENLSRPLMAAIPAISSRIPRGAIDEDAQPLELSAT